MDIKLNELILPDNTPVGEIPVSRIPETTKKQGPGFFRSVFEEFKEYTPEINIASTAIKEIQSLHPFDEEDIAPEGWSQFNLEAIDGLHPDDISDVLDQETPKQQQIMRDRKIEDRADREYLEDGSWVGRLIGGVAAFANPLSLMNKIPIAGQFKAVSKTAGFAKNLMRAAPGIAGQSALVNATRLANHDSMYLDDWFLDTVRDTVFGSAFFGAMGAKSAMQVQGRLKGMNGIYDDIAYKAKTTPDGELAGWEAFSPGGSAGAMKVNQAQKFVDEGYNLYGVNPTFKKFFKASPVVRMMTSPFSPVADWGQVLFRPSNILRLDSATTEGFQSAEQIATGLMAGAYNSKRIINNQWEKYAGINSNLPFKDTIGHLKKKMGEPGFLNRSKFNEEVAGAFRRGDKHNIPAVQEAAVEIRKWYDEVYQQAVKVGLLPKDLDVKTAQSYLNIVYNKKFMAVDGDGFKSAITKSLMEQSDEINRIMGPINALKETRESTLKLRKSLKGNKEKRAEYRKLGDELKSIKQNIDIQNTVLQESIENKSINQLLVSSKPHFGDIDNAKLEALHKPYIEQTEKFTKEISKLRADLAESRFEIKSLSKNRASKEKLESAKSIRNEIRENIKIKKKEKSTFESEFEDNLRTLRSKEAIDERFTYKSKSGLIKLRNPNPKPSLRRPMVEGEARDYVERVYQTILNQNEEQMLSQAFEDSGISGTNPLKRRSLLVPDEVKEPWLVNDMGRLANLYGGYMSKKIALETAFQKFKTTSNSGQKEIIGEIHKIHTAKRLEIESQPRTPKRDKALLKIDEDLKNGIELINNSIKAFMGNYNSDKYSPKFRSFLDGLRNWTASTALGALPLIQMTDIGMIIRQYGIADTFEESLFPQIKGMFNGYNKALKNDLAHGYMAINKDLASYGDELYGVGEDYVERGWINRFFSTAANKFGNITGSNQITDRFQMIAGNISQSKTYSGLKKYLSGGSLSKNELERFNLIGLDKEEWAKRIVNEFDEHGSFEHYKTGQAQIANIHLWKDREAARTLLNSIKQEVDTVILKPNIADVPFCMRDPLLQSMTMFMGYSFAATNQRLINLVQRPNAKAVMGELISMTIGAYVNPAREFLSGREPDLSKEALMASAVTNGAPGGIFVDGFNRINSIMNIPYLKRLRSDRYGGKGAAKLLLGAPGNLLDNIISITDTSLNIAGGGSPSESEITRMIKATPWLNAWQARKPVNALVKSGGFKKRTEKAEGLRGSFFSD